jgi:hypothetical protein
MNNQTHLGKQKRSKKSQAQLAQTPHHNIEIVRIFIQKFFVRLFPSA